MTRSLTNGEKLDNYGHAVYIGDQLLRKILLNECSFAKNSLTDAYLEGEAKGIKDMLYKLTRENKYNYTLIQLRDEYIQEEENEK